MRKLYPDTDLDALPALEELAKSLGAEGRKGDKEDEEQDGTGTAQFLTSELPEGWLVPAPRGGKHYVGPASLVYFAGCARKLVEKSNMLSQLAYDDQGLRRYLQATEFTTYKTSHTIEANIQGHPATFAAQAQESPSELKVASPVSLILPRTLDRNTTDQLVAAYFDRVHINFPVLHRAAFQMQYQRTYGQTMRQEPGWTCTLAMVYTLGAQALEPVLATSHQIQQDYLSIVVREGLGRLLLTSTLSNVQSLLLLALYQHNAGERNTAWILIGQAVRSAVALGLHRDGENSDFDPFERNIRRTVWWVMHMFEQFISLALGRPSFTDAINVNARIPEESYESGIGLPKGYLEHAVSLSQFIVRIKHAVGTLSVVYENTDRLVELYPAVMAIHAELIAWKKSCPPSLQLHQQFQSRQHRRLCFLQSVWADYLESVLCRPYLLCRITHDFKKSSRPEVIDEAASLSVSAAEACMTKLLMLADDHLLEGSVWLDFYCAQHAIMITSLHFLGQPTPPDGDSLKEALSNLIDTVQQTVLAPTYRITMNVALQLACIAGVGPDMGPPVPATNLPSSTSPVTGIPVVPPAPDQITSQNQTLEQLFGPMPPSAYHTEPDVYADHYNFGFNTENPWDFFNLTGEPFGVGAVGAGAQGNVQGNGDVYQGGFEFNGEFPRTG